MACLRTIADRRLQIDGLPLESRYRACKRATYQSAAQGVSLRPLTLAHGRPFPFAHRAVARALFLDGAGQRDVEVAVQAAGEVVHQVAAVQEQQGERGVDGGIVVDLPTAVLALVFEDELGAV